MRNHVVCSTAQQLLAALPEGVADCIYLDPPFGTGVAFEHYQDLGRQEALGLIGECLEHAWHALAPTGAIWLHLDEPATAAARVLATQFFGPGAVRTTVAWERTTAIKSGNQGLSPNTDSILLIAKPGFRARRLPASDYGYHRSHDGGPEFSTGDFSAPRASDNQHLVYGITSPFTGKVCYPAPGRHWTSNIEHTLGILRGWGVTPVVVNLDDVGRRRAVTAAAQPGTPGIAYEETPDAARAAALQVLHHQTWPEIFFGMTGAGGPRRKKPKPDTSTIGTFWSAKAAGHARTAVADLRRSLPGTPPFATPKPEKLLRRIIALSTDANGLVIDPFAGSGTAAAAALQLGRSFVTGDQLPGTLDTFVRPRLDSMIAGDAPWVEERYVATSAYKVHSGEAFRSVDVIRAYQRMGKFEHVGSAAVDALCAELLDADRTQEIVRYAAGGSYDYSPSIGTFQRMLDSERSDAA